MFESGGWGRRVQGRGCEPACWGRRAAVSALSPPDSAYSSCARAAAAAQLPWGAVRGRESGHDVALNPLAHRQGGERGVILGRCCRHRGVWCGPVQASTRHVVWPICHHACV
eukprot:3373217-Prymnesium_polylepis.1